jgi:hypothetical protein
MLIFPFKAAESVAKSFNIITAEQERYTLALPESRFKA